LDNGPEVRRGPLTDAQSSVRNAGLLLAQWTFHVAGAAAFAILVPRMMGPEVFGQYSLLTAIAMWFAFLSGLGALSVLTRTVPQLVAAGDRAGLERLVTSLVTLRSMSGLFTATSYGLLVTLAFGFRDWPSVALVAAAVWTRTAANICFALFLGLNRAARWGIGDLVRRWLILAFVVIGFPIAGLRGACAGFLLANVIVLVLGFAQAWPYLHWKQLDLSRRYLAPFIRTGTSFAAGNLLIAMVQRSGEAVLTLSARNFVEVGYFGAAYAIYLTLAQALWQANISFAPLLIKQVHAGDTALARMWLGRILKWMLIAVSMVAASLLVLGRDLVPLLLGPAYVRVGTILVPLALALFSLAVGSVGRLAALTVDRPRILVTAAALELAIFWTVGLLFAPRGGSLAVCIAAALASASYTTWITWRVRREIQYPYEAARRVGVLALIFVPLIWVPFGLAVRAALFTVTCTVFGGLLWRTGLVTLDEVAALKRAARPVPGVVA
jgi:O-antigen/teichoic acid export membrane protein